MCQRFVFIVFFSTTFSFFVINITQFLYLLFMIVHMFIVLNLM
jgi:hypothetical protein